MVRTPLIIISLALFCTGCGTVKKSQSVALNAQSSESSQTEIVTGTAALSETRSVAEISQSSVTVTVTEQYDTALGPDPGAGAPPLVKRTTQTVYKTTDAVIHEVLRDQYEQVQAITQQVDIAASVHSEAHQTKERKSPPVAFILVLCAAAVAAMVLALLKKVKRP